MKKHWMHYIARVLSLGLVIGVTSAVWAQSTPPGNTGPMTEAQRKEKAYLEAIQKRQREIIAAMQKRSDETAKSLELKISLPFHNNHFKEIIGFYRQAASLPMVVNEQAIANAGVGPEMRITMKSDEKLPIWLALQESLDRFSELADEQLQYGVSNGVVLVSSMRDRVTRKRFLDDGSPLSRILFQKMELQWVKYTVVASDPVAALKVWEQQSGVKMVVNEKAMAALKLKQNQIRLMMEERPVVALELILEQIEGDTPQLAVMLNQGVLYVSSIDELVRSRIYRSDQSEASVAAFKKLAVRTQLKTPYLTWGDLIKLISEERGVLMVVDWPQLQKLGITPESKLKLTTSPMAGDALLRLGMSMFDSNLSYYLEQGILRLSTKPVVASWIKEEPGQ